MEIEVGEFVRTRNQGIIDKVIIDYHGVCNSPNCNCKHVSCEKNYYDEEDIVKHSKHLIDLIEVGDYINGERVAEITKNHITIGNLTYGKMRLKNIKTILTYEVFKRNCYRVEEE